MIRFLHDQTLVELDDVSCNLTVLDWLRLDQCSTGTKEGCGSGDCGACTVVVASPVIAGKAPPTLKYEAINSCITFIGSLHGKRLLTVESLAGKNSLHPAQQAMVDEHGSQCGFCTPGFVMSLYALYNADESKEMLEKRIDQALGGNLCRCTGYRPIRQAAIGMLDMRDAVEQGLSSTANEASVPTDERMLLTRSAVNKSNMTLARKLRSLSAHSPKLANFHQPRSIEEFADIYLKNPHYHLLGGGTDLALEVTQKLQDLDGLIHVARVPELTQIEVSGDALVLGAGVTLSQCMPIMKERIPGAEELLMRFGSDQIRNLGTIGGNFGSASPIGDLPPLLLALNSVIELQKGDQCRHIPLDNFFVGYRQTVMQAGEFIRSIRISLPSPESIFSVHKVSKRRDDDISTVCMAIHLPQNNGMSQGVRLAFGGMAATPIRATKAESELEDKPFDNLAVRNAQQALAVELEPLSDARASSAYRMQVAQNLLQRVLMEVTLS